MWEKGGIIYALYRSIQRTHHVYFQWLLQDCHTLCGYHRMAWQGQAAAKRNIFWIHGIVVVLDGRQPACVRRLALRKFCSGLWFAFWPDTPLVNSLLFYWFAIIIVRLTSCKGRLHIKGQLSRKISKNCIHYISDGLLLQKLISVAGGGRENLTAFRNF